MKEFKKASKIRPGICSKRCWKLNFHCLMIARKVKLKPDGVMMKVADQPHNLMSNQKFKSFVNAFTELMSATQSVSLPEARQLSRKFFLPDNTIYESVASVLNKKVV